MSETMVLQVVRNAERNYVVPTANPSVTVTTIDRLVRLASTARPAGKLVITLVVQAEDRVTQKG
jgi:hypothetical protein